MVTASRTNARHVITRDISFFKRLKVSKAESTAKRDVTEVDEMGGDNHEFVNNDLDPDQIGSENEETRINKMRKTMMINREIQKT